jgi:hypothetical protein
VFALLGALALEEWREDSERMELANRAKLAIEQELLANKKQLEDKLIKHNDMLKSLTKQLNDYRAKGNQDAQFDFNYPMATLTSSAWDTARMTQSAQFMQFEDVREFSMVYNFQSLYEDNQKKLIEMVMSIGNIRDEEFEPFTNSFIHRLTILIDVNNLLREAYTKTLDLEPDQTNEAI